MARRIASDLFLILCFKRHWVGWGLAQNVQKGTRIKKIESAMSVKSLEGHWAYYEYAEHPTLTCIQGSGVCEKKYHRQATFSRVGLPRPPNVQC